MLLLETRKKELIYCGAVIDGKKEGLSWCQDKSSKDVWECTFTNNQINGPARVYFANGDYFEGNAYEGCLKKGTLHYRDGSSYIGEFKDTKLDGIAQLYTPNRELVAEGYFTDGHSTKSALLPNTKIPEPTSKDCLPTA